MRQPWPPFEGDAKAIAGRLVEALAIGERAAQLARIAAAPTSPDWPAALELSDVDQSASGHR